MFEKKKEFKLITKKNPKSLLPNALTILGVCLGLSSIKFALDANYAMAIISIGFAAILDTLDGRVARLIKGTSKVGKELDSLTDVISFGVAPGFIMYFWVLNGIGKLYCHQIIRSYMPDKVFCGRRHQTNLSNLQSWLMLLL